MGKSQQKLAENLLSCPLRNQFFNFGEFFYFFEPLESVSLLISDPTLVVLVPCGLEMGIEVSWDFSWFIHMLAQLA